MLQLILGDLGCRVYVHQFPGGGEGAGSMRRRGMKDKCEQNWNHGLLVYILLNFIYSV